MSTKKPTIALFGPNGKLGSVLLSTLASSNSFNITIIQRESSSYTLPTPLSTKSNIRLTTVDDTLSLPRLTSALQNHDAVIVAIPVSDPSQHIRIASAAASAGVRRVIPADFGSCDADSVRAQELVPLFRHKVDIRAHLQELSDAAAVADTGKEDGNDFVWTSIVCGHFFDWGLRDNFLHFDLERRTADILDDGIYRGSTSTLSRVAEAVVAVLRRDVRDPDTRNKVLFVQSFCVSQLDVLAALERATGGQAWERRKVDSEAFIAEHKAKTDAGNRESIEELVFALGVIDGNWENREGFAMDILGLKNEDLDEVVRGIVKS